MARKAKKRAMEGFYAQALSQAERVGLEQAMELEGLDEEIALLRLRLRGLVSEHPENMPLLIRGMELLVKAVSAKYRLSKDARESLADAMADVLKEIGGAMFPEGFSGD